MAEISEVQEKTIFDVKTSSCKLKLVKVLSAIPGSVDLNLKFRLFVDGRNVHGDVDIETLCGLLGHYLMVENSKFEKALAQYGSALPTAPPGASPSSTPPDTGASGSRVHRIDG